MNIKKKIAWFYKKIKTIFLTSWISIGFELITLVLTIVCWTVLIQQISQVEPIQNTNWGITLAPIISCILAIVFYNFNVINAVIILSTDFKIKSILKHICNNLFSRNCIIDLCNASKKWIKDQGEFINGK